MLVCVVHVHFVYRIGGLEWLWYQRMVILVLHSFRLWASGYTYIVCSLENQALYTLGYNSLES